MPTLVIITASDDSEARLISKTLVEEKLIVCANRFPVESIFRWQGEIIEDAEVMLFCKTREELLERLIKRVKELHSYDVPEIIAIPIVGGSKNYLNWVKENTLD